MPLETATTIPELNQAWPVGTDPKSQGDDHLRMIKDCVKNSLPNMDGPWSTTDPIAAGEAVEDGQLVTKAQLDAATGVKQSFGAVASGGTITGGSGDWTVSRSGNNYTLTFDTAATDAASQSLVATGVVVDGAGDCVAVSLNATQVQVSTYNANGAYLQSGFFFMRNAV